MASTASTECQDLDSLQEINAQNLVVQSQNNRPSYRE